MIGCITQEARAQAEKGRKKREREERARMMPGSDVHAAAEGAVGHVMDDDCPPDLGKAFENVGIATGPGQPMVPGQISPQDFGRPLITDGHEAASPGQGPPNTPHVDLRGDRGMARPLSPHAPLPVEGPADR